MKKTKRRVSGIGKLDIEGVAMDVFSTGTGAALPEIIINKALPNMSKKITGFGQLVAGAAVKAFMPGNKFAEGAGSGMIAGAVLRLINEFAPGLFGASAPVQGIGEGDFRETALTVDTDFDSVDGLERETPDAQDTKGPTKS